MKKIKKALISFLVLVFVCCSLCIIVSAESPKEVVASQNVWSVAEKAEVSCALDVLAHQNSIAFAGLKGNVLNFSADRIACAMNLSSVEKITVTELPDILNGSLYVGSEGVSVGQTLSAAAISLMTYEENEAGVCGDSTFKFTVNDGSYEMTCNIYMLDEINYSPTVSMASYASLNTKTYKNVEVVGVMSAYDPEGDELKYEIVSYPEHGRVEIENRALGTYTYIPSSSFTGEDRFKYVVCDKYGNYSASAEISVSVSAQNSAVVYSDMINDTMYSHAISMTENGLMNGVQVGNCYYFEADREVSRVDFLVTAMNAIGIRNVPTVDETGFCDDDDISPEMKGYVDLAYSKGYISGTKSSGNIYFYPNEKIKLSEAAVIISNMIGYAKSEITPVFADADAIPSWSSGAIESLYTLGILEIPDMNVEAGATITRGTMAKLLDKTMFVIGK